VSIVSCASAGEAPHSAEASSAEVSIEVRMVFLPLFSYVQQAGPTGGSAVALLELDDIVRLPGLIEELDTCAIEAQRREEVASFPARSCRLEHSRFASESS
jgi:hypothetical protein